MKVIDDGGGEGVGLANCPSVHRKLCTRSQRNKVSRIAPDWILVVLSEETPEQPIFRSQIVVDFHSILGDLFLDLGLEDRVVALCVWKSKELKHVLGRQIHPAWLSNSWELSTKPRSRRICRIYSIVRHPVPGIENLVR